MSMINVSELEFTKLSRFIMDLAGINLLHNPKNVTLVTSRLNKHLVRRGIQSYEEYLKVLALGDKEVVEEFISSLTTNTTSFFREPMHFERLKQVTSDILLCKKLNKNNSLRVWCSVSSTGQEAYTILFTLLEGLIDTTKIDLHFLASDIDLEVLEKARLGKYHEREVAQIPSNILNKYFSRDDQYFQVKERYRKMITFARFNLIQSHFDFQYKFDIVFCRNVLIYFQHETIDQVIRNIYRCMTDSGYLFLGHSESGLADRKLFDIHSSAVYRAKGRKVA